MSMLEKCPSCGQRHNVQGLVAALVVFGGSGLLIWSWA